MQEYYDVLDESSEDDVKSDMALVLNICANNDIDTEADAKRIYTILNNNSLIFKSGIGRLFINELHDRILDFRFIEKIKQDNDLSDLTVVRSLVESINHRNDVLKSYGGQEFLQQLIRIEKELEVIQIINDNYDINNKDTAWSLYVILEDEGKGFFKTEQGLKFMRLLEKKSGVVSAETRPHKRLAIIIAVMFFIAGAGLGITAKYVYDDKKSSMVYEQVENIASKGSTSFFATPVPENVGNETQSGASQKASLNISANLKVLDKYSELVSKNTDMAGWIRLDGTDINYPVMHISNNSFYLEHDFYGNYDRNGSLFIDRYCSIYPQSENIIIYGHNVNGAPSFGQIKYYKEKKFFDYHPVVYFDTIYEKGQYEVVAAFTTSVETNGFKYYLFYGYDNEEQFNEFRDYIKKQSIYDTGTVLNYGDKYITLSTCDSAVSEGRFVVVARKK